MSSNQDGEHTNSESNIIFIKDYFTNDIDNKDIDIEKNEQPKYLEEVNDDIYIIRFDNMEFTICDTCASYAETHKPYIDENQFIMYCTSSNGSNYTSANIHYMPPECHGNRCEFCGCDFYP